MPPGERDMSITLPVKDISEIRFGTHHARGTRVINGGRVCGTYVGTEPTGHIDICWDHASFDADRFRDRCETFDRDWSVRVSWNGLGKDLEDPTRPHHYRANRYVGRLAVLVGAVQGRRLKNPHVYMITVPSNGKSYLVNREGRRFSAAQLAAAQFTNQRAAALAEVTA